MSSQFGVQRLVLLNSGGFRCAEFDLTSAVHLAANNNVGKSTLVNALQFLFIDDFEKMVFGDYDLANTRQHYFGNAPSYIVFECLTRNGPQCLLVFGSGDISVSRFSRLVYRGRFELAQYKDDAGRLIDVTRLRQRLLSADVLDVKHGRLWRVLCRPNDLRADDEEAARFGILPLKRVEDYHAFREVFIRLLGLNKATADDLKRLLIACSCQRIHVSSVDVKREYAEQFSRLEHGDLELKWLKAVASHIDQGISLRHTITETNHRLSATAIDARREMRRCEFLERNLTSVAHSQRAEITQELRDIRSKQDSLNRKFGELGEKLLVITRQVEELDAAHRRWEGISDLELAAWHSRQSELDQIIQATQIKLHEAETYDLSSLEREYERKHREFEQRSRELEDWESRTSGYLQKLGFDPKQVSRLFTLINPDLARASHNAVFGTSTSDSVASLVTRVLAAHVESSFVIDGVSINTSSVQLPEDPVSQTREIAIERVQFLDKDVSQFKALLEVARDLKATEEKLQRANTELKEVSERLREYSEHGKLHATRSSMIVEIESWKSMIDSTQEELSRVGQKEKELTTTLSELNAVEGDLKRWNDLRTRMTSQLKEIEIGDGSSDTDRKFNIQATNALAVKDELQKACKSLEDAGRTLLGLARERTETATKVLRIQQEIAAEVRRQRAPRAAIFDQDVEREWQELERMKEALGENEQQLNALWNAMFKSLAGGLDLLRRSVAEIKKRASRINADLKRYRVSNLESVELQVDHETLAYTTIERMTSADSMFLNDRDIEEAKSELRRWIIDGKTIELRDLFTIRIRIQNCGEVRHVEVASLDVIGSKGTGITAKVMIYLQLLRSIIDDQKDEYQMHFYLDEIGSLDDRNLRATTEMASLRGFTPITAELEPRADALAHPEVRIYHLGMNGKNVEIVHELTHVVRAKHAVAKVAK